MNKSTMVYQHRETGVRVSVIKPTTNVYVGTFPDGTKQTITYYELRKSYRYMKKESKLVKYQPIVLKRSPI